MNRKIHIFKQIILPLILFVLLAGSLSLKAEPWFDDTLNLQIATLINDIRSNPWAEAERLGFDVNELRESLAPDVIERWDGGLPSLTVDDRLIAAAKKHVVDMLTNYYYSHLSLDGKGVEERLVSEEFYPVFLAESMGAVVFQNVISIEEASSLIIQGLFYDAFNGGGEGAALLSDKATHIGLAISGGQMQINGTVFNVFVLVVDIARDISVPPEAVLLWGHV